MNKGNKIGQIHYHEEKYHVEFNYSNSRGARVVVEGMKDNNNKFIMKEREVGDLGKVGF